MSRAHDEELPSTRPEVRTSEPASSHTYSFGPFRLDVATRELRKGADLVPLQPKTFDTLLFLVTHGHRVVSKDELMRAIWPDTVVSEESLTQNIKIIRRALGDDATKPEFIVTVARRGYRFRTPVTDTEAASPALGSPGHEASDRTSTAVQATPRVRVWAPWLTAAAAVLVMGFWMLPRAGTDPAQAATPLFIPLDTPDGVTLESGGVLSPNGRYLAFVGDAMESRRTRVWIRDLTTGRVESWPDTEGAVRPFWSPGSDQLAYFVKSDLWVLRPQTGVTQRLSSSTQGLGGGAWGPDSTLVISNGRGALEIVSTSGASRQAATTLDSARQEKSHQWPQFLPDGRLLYYVVSANPELSGTVVTTLGSAQTRRMIDVPAIYQDGCLIFVRERVLFIQPFDLGTVASAGPPVAVAGDVESLDVASGAWFSASSTGVLAYGGGTSSERVMWFDRSGRRTGTVEVPGAVRNPRLSSDGQALFLSTPPEGGRRTVWRVDVERGGSTAVAGGMRPIPAPDGHSVAFTLDSEGGFADIYRRPVQGRAEDEMLLQNSENKALDDWSPDGRYLVYSSISRMSESNVWLLPLFGDRTPQRFLRTSSNEKDARVSPDGRQIAYASDESGTWQVYVQSFPEPGAKRVVSIDGGVQPRWGQNGAELLYLTPDLMLMAVRIPKAATEDLGRPTALFRLPLANRAPYLTHYDVTRDGQRIVVHGLDVDGKRSPVTLVTNWSLLSRTR